MLGLAHALNGRGAWREPGSPKASAIERLRFSLLPAFGTIEFGDRVGAEFVNPVRYAVFLVLARSEGTLNQDMSPLCKRFGVFGEFSEGDNPMPIGSALPFAGGIFP